MIKIVICGVCGKMGNVLVAAAEKNNEICIVAGVDKFIGDRVFAFPVYKDINDVAVEADVIIDFSRPDALDSNLAFAQQKGLRIVVATTGFSNDDILRIAEAANDIPIFFSANMSLGVNLQIELSKKAAAFLGEAYDIEIIEKHHNQKVDAPSGTALAIADSINSMFIEPKGYEHDRHAKTEPRGREIGLHAVRGGTIVGEHTVMFIGTDEIIEVNHIAQSKSIFALGALRAALYLAEKPAGLYDMNDIIMQCAINNIFESHGQAMITLSDLPFAPDVISGVFADIAAKDIKLDIIGQSAPHNGYVDLSFSMLQKDLSACESLLARFVQNETKIVIHPALSKLTVEGAGIQRQSGIAAKLFGALAEKGISVYLITTSDTNIYFCVDADKAKDAMNVVSAAFAL